MGKVLVLDPGHGGHDPGALGPSGLKEADVVLADAHALRKELARRRPDLTVAMTREGDRYLSLTARARFANRFPEDSTHFLSLHCNSATNPARGFEVFTSPGQTLSDPFATALFLPYEGEFPEMPARRGMGDGDVDKEAKFTVLTATAGPAALFELEFIHTPQGEAFLADPAIRARRVKALADGIEAHLFGEVAAPGPGVWTDFAVPQAGPDLEAIRRHARAILEELEP